MKMGLRICGRYFGGYNCCKFVFGAANSLMIGSTGVKGHEYWMNNTYVGGSSAMLASQLLPYSEQDLTV